MRIQSRMNSIGKLSYEKVGAWMLLILSAFFAGDIAFARDFTAVTKAAEVDLRSYGWALASAVGAAAGLIVMVSRQKGLEMLANVALGIGTFLFIGIVILAAKSWS